MSKNIEFKTIGKIKQAHGLRGESTFCAFRVMLIGLWIAKLHLKVGERQHKIKIFKRYKKGLLIKIPSVVNRNQSEELVGSMVSVPEEYLISQPGEEIFLSEIEGFNVRDVNAGDLGVITGFSSMEFKIYYSLIILRDGWKFLLLKNSPKN
ncbi:MAG: hypothetical protein R2827_10360 [Bdellovibrionales bacterium]